MDGNQTLAVQKPLVKGKEVVGQKSSKYPQVDPASGKDDQVDNTYEDLDDDHNKDTEAEASNRETFADRKDDNVDVNIDDESPNTDEMYALEFPAEISDIQTSNKLMEKIVHD
ncbi:hypothetical protein ACH5RR_018285 [Cinchona calisaya]|uniref:Uncharacterized protein n=1 Tax=Cinchona calisaya TaxID=153742 RepID=A0ABD2ZMP0_9GENT